MAGPNWDESKHPRVPAGSAQGGEFTSGNGGSAATPNWGSRAMPGWEGLPAKVREAFTKLGQDQRSEPELAMLEVHKAMGSGVLNPVVEHVGDLTNRLSPEHALDWGTDAALDKVDRSLRALDHPYGFDREFKENVVSNAKFNGVPEATFMSGVEKALGHYAEAHAALDVYNRVQWLAREAAVNLGQMEWSRASDHLHSLRDTLESDPNAVKDYKLDASGKLKVLD